MISKPRRLRFMVCVTSGLLISAAGVMTISLGAFQSGASAAATPTPPFTECPAVGYNNTCSLLINVTSSGDAILDDPAATMATDPVPGTYDGDDDTLIGILNNSSVPVSQITLSSATEPIFEFDGDGICENPNDTSGLPGLTGADCNTTDTTTYGGPDAFFTNISTDFLSGTVNFITPIAPGASTYFSLEEALTTTDITPPTSLSTSLSGGGQTGATISVPESTSVTDTATLTGTNAATATGTVTYDVYSDSACTMAVSSGTAQTITTPGTLPASSPVSLPNAGTYYWQASYSGDTDNGSSLSVCGTGGEVETVTGASLPVTTTLSGGGQDGATISVPESTSVTDTATLTGTNAATATGTVTYDVYSDSACTMAVSSGTAQTITTPGTLPASSPVSLPNAGTYYWQASYSGDTAIAASKSTCGSTGEVETVVAPVVAPTTLSTSLSGGGQTGATISVPESTSVTDTATLAGTNAATATGTITYDVYSDSACTMAVSSGTAQTTTAPGTVPASSAVTLSTPGTYYWQALYSGDTKNGPSQNTCGSETETVNAPQSVTQPTTIRTYLQGGRSGWWSNSGNGQNNGHNSGRHNGYNNDTITVTSGTAVTDSATLKGADVSTATGTVSYSVFSDSACSVSAGSGGTVDVTAGSVPSSTTVTLTTPGTYYWQASYSGDADNAPSTSTCGSEVEIVNAPTPQPTHIQTSLLGGSTQNGGWNRNLLTVSTGTPVSDSATLSGPNVSSAGGTVTYTVYSDQMCFQSQGGQGSQWGHGQSQGGGGQSQCSPQMVSTDTETVVGGVVPNSAPVTLTAGFYSWQASYSGDATNAPSQSRYGSETLIVAAPRPQPTQIQTALVGGTMQSGWWNEDLLTVSSGTPVSDSATLSGPNVSSAGGTVTYTVYSNQMCFQSQGGQGSQWGHGQSQGDGGSQWGHGQSQCSPQVVSTDTETVVGGVVPNSAPVTLTAGFYSWQATYSGAATNAASQSRYGSETLIVGGGTTGHSRSGSSW
jgi:hypothetical protein